MQTGINSRMKAVMIKNNSKRFGYCRVSSKDQNEDRQYEAMLAQGINERDIFIDKCSGKDFDRPSIKRPDNWEDIYST